MIVSIHQPHYFPWLRYVNKIAMSDVFVIYDDVKYEKNDWVHRTMIADKDRIRITVPVHHSSSSYINNVKIANNHWKRKHLNSIYYSYHNSPNFMKYYPDISRIISLNTDKLVDYNVESIKWIVSQLGLKTKILRSSQMNVKASSTTRLVKICKELSADKYLSGKYAISQYLNQQEFSKENIKVVYSDFVSYPYKQRYNKFIADLSIIDLLMNQSVEFANQYLCTCNLCEL